MADAPWYETLPIPALMRHARGAYRDASRRSLTAAGFEDLPRNGGFVIAGLDQGLPEPKATTQAEAVHFLGVSKQAASQLIDTLVVRGYLEREIDPADRRRMTVRLTERGVAAAVAIQDAVDSIDAELAQRISPEELRGLRAGLAAVTELRDAANG